MKTNVEYLETYYEIVAGFYSNPQSKVLEEIESTQGRGGMWEFAQKLTDEFMELYKDFVWDGDFFDTVDKFLNEML